MSGACSIPSPFSLTDNSPHLAMGQNLGTEMGGGFTYQPKWDGFLTDKPGPSLSETLRS